MRFERIWADDESIDAMAEAVKDARQSISSAATPTKLSAAHAADGHREGLVDQDL